MTARMAARISPRLRWLIWVAGLALWTYLLVVPVDWLPPWLRFKGTARSRLLSWSKIGHASAYAALTAFVPLLPVGLGGRIALWGLVSAHAFLTELIQTFVPTRSGELADIAIDHFGMLVGLLLSLLWPSQWKPPPVQGERHAG